MPPFGNCLLGSVNLAKFVRKPFTEAAYIDWDRLKEVVTISVEGLNEVLHEGIPLHPLKEQRDTANKYRQIGLGIMGLADMFVMMGVKYGDGESLEISKNIGKVIRDVAIETSIELVRKYGVYPGFDRGTILQSPYFKELPVHLQQKIQRHGMANSHVLSIAPTGSISTMFGVSGGIEPIFANSFVRTTKSLYDGEDVNYKVYTKVINDLMDEKEIISESELPEYCITSHDIQPLDRIKVQSIWQKYIDSAISSTINLKEETTVEEIEDIYKQAFKYGLKGVTVFRDNCFRTGILTTESEQENTEDTITNPCPDCGAEMKNIGGCLECIECGNGLCGI